MLKYNMCVINAVCDINAFYILPCLQESLWVPLKLNVYRLFLFFKNSLIMFLVDSKIFASFQTRIFQ